MPLLNFTLYYFNHYKSYGGISPNGFYTYKQHTLIDNNTYREITDLNDNIKSSRILNVFITNRKLDGYSFLFSELKGYISVQNSYKSKFLNQVEHFDRVHMYFDNSYVDKFYNKFKDIPHKIKNFTPQYSYLHLIHK